MLDGSKHFVTNAGCADLFLVFATMNPRLNWRGVTAFLLPRNAPGLSLGSEQRLIGLSGCSISTIHLDSATVPRSAVLGHVGAGSLVFRHAMLWERSLLSALSLGSMRRKLTGAINVATTRNQSKGNSTAYPDLAGPVVNILGRYLVGRLLVRDTVAKLAADALTPAEVSLTKLWISEAEVASSEDFAGLENENGLLESSAYGRPLQRRRWNDLLGTSDIQRMIIAAELGIPE